MTKMHNEAAIGHNICKKMKVISTVIGFGKCYTTSSIAYDPSELSPFINQQLQRHVVSCVTVLNNISSPIN